MKSIKYIFLLLLVAALTSCVADLEEYNPSGDTADNIFATEAGHTGLVNMAYYQWRGNFYGRENPVGLAMVGTDIWNAAPGRWDYFPTAQYNEAKLNSANEGLMKNSWERLYIIVNNCNAAIERGPEAQYKDTVVRNQRIAEAHFHRAFAYWHIVENWGNVVLKLDETKTAVSMAQRSSVSAFYEQCILPDLEKAAAVLPTEQADHARVTKAAAQGMLARMYLTYASYLKYFEANSVKADEFYQKAKTAAEAIITNPTAYKAGLGLYDDVKEIFAESNNKNNKEAMFVVNHSTEVTLNQETAHNRLPSYWVASYNGKNMGVQLSKKYGYQETAFLAPTRYFLNLYDAAKDARYRAFFREVWYCNDSKAKTQIWSINSVKLFHKDTTLFTPGDADTPDKYRTKLGFNVGDTAMWFTKQKVANKAAVKYAVRDIDDMFEEGTNKFKRETNDYLFPQLTKYSDTIYPTSGVRNSSGRLDVIIMRFAEMYLISAEASVELGDLSAAKERINDLRLRTRINGVSNDITEADFSTSPSGADPINWILDERARELCGEHLRWFDLKRTKQLEKRLGEGKANPDVTEFKPDKHYLRPVPASFLRSITNGAEFGQNPGY